MMTTALKSRLGGDSLARRNLRTVLISGVAALSLGLYCSTAQADQLTCDNPAAIEQVLNLTFCKHVVNCNYVGVNTVADFGKLSSEKVENLVRAQFPSMKQRLERANAATKKYAELVEDVAVKRMQQWQHVFTSTKTSDITTLSYDPQMKKLTCQVQLLFDEDKLKLALQNQALLEVLNIGLQAPEFLASLDRGEFPDAMLNALYQRSVTAWSNCFYRKHGYSIQQGPSDQLLVNVFEDSFDRSCAAKYK